MLVSSILQTRRTRSTNLDRHPGKEPGLHWRENKVEKVNKLAQAAAKRDRAAARKAKKVLQKQQEEDGCLELAALEDKQHEEEQAEMEYLQRSAAVGYRGQPRVADAVRARMEAGTHALGPNNTAQAPRGGSSDSDNQDDSSDDDDTAETGTQVRSHCPLVAQCLT